MSKGVISGLGFLQLVVYQQMNRNDEGVWIFLRVYGRSSVLGVVVLIEGYREKPFSVIFPVMGGTGNREGFRVSVPSSNLSAELAQTQTCELSLTPFKYEIQSLLCSILPFTPFSYAILFKMLSLFKEFGMKLVFRCLLRYSFRSCLDLYT